MDNIKLKSVYTITYYPVFAKVLICYQLLLRHVSATILGHFQGAACTVVLNSICHSHSHSEHGGPEASIHDPFPLTKCHNTDVRTQHSTAMSNYSNFVLCLTIN